MIVDPRLNCVVAGARFDLAADDVVEFCAERVQGKRIVSVMITVLEPSTAEGPPAERRE